MNNRGEARISNFVFSVVIAVTLMVLLSSFIVNMAVNNDARSTVEFQKYETYLNAYDGLYANATEEAQNIDKAKAAINESESGWIKNSLKAIDVAWSESIVGRAYNGIVASLKMSTIATKGANAALKTIPSFPTYAVTLVWILILLAIAFAFMRALWEKKI